MCFLTEFLYLFISEIFVKIIFIAENMEKYGTKTNLSKRYYVILRLERLLLYVMKIFVIKYIFIYCINTLCLLANK